MYISSKWPIIPPLVKNGCFGRCFLTLGASKITRVTHIRSLFQICHRFIILWQICHKFSSVTPISQMTLFSGPDFVLIESASLLLPIVHTLTIFLSRKLSYQQDCQPIISADPMVDGHWRWCVRTFLRSLALPIGKNGSASHTLRT